MSTDYAHTPMTPPPPGVTSNFVNPESRANVFVGVVATCLSLMLPIVVMRLYSRLWINRSFAVDDAACILATIGTVGCASVMWSMTNILGRHTWDVPIINYNNEYVRKNILAAMAYGPTIFFAKLSLFWLYLRIFAISRRTRYLIYFGIAATFAVYTATTAYFGYWFIPRPGQSWLKRLSTEYGKTRTLNYSQAIFGVLSDLYLFVLPIPVVWQLQVSLRKRIGICLVFATGSLACIASIANLCFRMKSYVIYDSIWIVLAPEILAIVELSVGVMCGCIPHLVSLFRHHRVKSTFAYLKNVSSQIMSKISKRSLLSEKGNGDKHNNFDRVNSSPTNEHYIETQVLGSVQGEGKFLKSGDHAQRDFMWRQSNPGHSTYREAWD